MIIILLCKTDCVLKDGSVLMIHIYITICNVIYLLKLLLASDLLVLTKTGIVIRDSLYDPVDVSSQPGVDSRVTPSCTTLSP